MAEAIMVEATEAIMVEATEAITGTTDITIIDGITVGTIGEDIPITTTLITAPLTIILPLTMTITTILTITTLILLTTLVQLITIITTNLIQHELLWIRRFAFGLSVMEIMG